MSVCVKTFLADVDSFSHFITPEHFSSVPQLLRQRVTLEDVNDLYNYLRQVSKKRPKRAHDDGWVTLKALSEAGFLVTGRKGNTLTENDTFHFMLNCKL